MTGAALVVQGDALHLPLPDGSVEHGNLGEWCGSSGGERP
jgi:hypothetical protein